MRPLIWLISVTLFLTGCREDNALHLKMPSAQIISALDQNIPDLLIDHKVPGLTLSVFRNGKVEFTRAYGHLSQSKVQANSSKTIFQAASLGKPVFALVVLKLADLGSFDLDRPLVTYKPDLFEQYSGPTDQITARMALSHTSGLPNFGESGNALAFTPGSKFKYAGLGYSLLQQVIEQVSGKPLQELANELVFQPAGMINSGFVWRDDWKAEFAKGHNTTGEPLSERKHHRNANAAYSLYTTAPDYARFMAYSIKLAQNNALLKDSFFNSKIEITNLIGWSYGWGIQNTKPHPSFWHWGSNLGYRAYAVGYPNQKIGVVVLSNGESMFKSVDKIVKLAIGGTLPSYDWF